MTLPTGVSTFLIECLDQDSAADYNTTSDSLKSCSSPETFRCDDSEGFHFYSVDPGKYKNSTLLDSNEAVTIDSIPQISNFSAILEPVPEDFQDRCIRRKRPSNCNYSSSALSISTTLAGKKLQRITAARERTPDLKSGVHCSSPLAPESKPDNQTAKAKRLKKKENRFNLLEEGSSFRQLDAPGNTSAKSKGLTAVVLPTKPTDAVVPLCDRQEICSIVRLSPGQRPSRLQQVPVKRKEFHLPKGMPEGKRTWTWFTVQ
ncbi:MEIKN protein, partial [Climacteris rufus]|nr:MEIKN protein [Climacteris rufus]